MDVVRGIPDEMVTMVDHGHHGISWSMMVDHELSWSAVIDHDLDHGQTWVWPWSQLTTMVNHGHQSHDHGQSRTNMVDHGQIKMTIRSVKNKHGWPWSANYDGLLYLWPIHLTMVDHDPEVSLNFLTTVNQFLLIKLHITTCNRELTMIDYGEIVLVIVNHSQWTVNDCSP